MQKMTATWTGWSGAPGTTSIYFQGAAIVNPSVLKAFFDAVAPYTPTTVTIQVNNSGELVDPPSGKVTGSWSTSSVASTAGTATAQAMTPSSGIQVRIETGTFRDGKHIRGRFYLIPGATGSYTNTGQITGTVTSAIQTAANTLVSASGSQIGVYHRALYDTSVKPPVLKRSGEFIVAQSLLVLGKPASLTSRRD
jgi:hypothetical protein